MPIYTTAFASYYDILNGPDKTIAKTTKKLLKKYFAKNTKVKLLELGCGTGNILQEMPKAYQLFGLDISKSMLDIARKKLPQATFIQADMAAFQLKDTFDAIICVFDSINHLTTWKMWQSMMRKVHQHLQKGGIFIFDMNTMRRMATLATFKPYVAKIDKDTAVFVKVEERNSHLYSGQFIILQHITGKNPIAIEQLVDEAVFPIQQIEEELQKYFTIEKIIDPIRKRVSGKSGRVFFVCWKKQEK